MDQDLGYLPRLRDRGFVIRLADGDRIDIRLPKELAITPKISTWLVENKPNLKAELRAEQLAAESAVYRYQRHSTRTDSHGQGHLDISFENIETGEVTEIFFNVHLNYRRGSLKGSYFNTGANGQFWVRAGSNFAIFWTETFGDGADWSRVWRQIKRLKPLRFSGEVKDAETKEGTKSYQHITNLKRVQL